MKIYIMGAAGSGKTTLAQKLAVKYQVPHFDLDKIKWENTATYNQKRDKVERAQMLADVLKNNTDWICEGVYFRDWIYPVLEAADEVIILQPPRYLRQYRCLRRSIRRLLKLEPSKYKESFSSVYQLLRWSHDYDTKYLPLALDKIKRDNIKYRILKKWDENTI